MGSYLSALEGLEPFNVINVAGISSLATPSLISNKIRKGFGHERNAKG